MSPVEVPYRVVQTEGVEVEGAVRRLWSVRAMFWGICLLAALVRLAAFVGLDRFRQPELWENDTVAVNLLEGRGFVFTELGAVHRSFVEPLYPGLTAAVYFLSHHSFVALGLVQVLLGAALVWPVFECARRVAGERVGLLAGLLVALHPGLILYTTKFHPFVLDTLLFTSVVAAALAFSPRRPWRWIMGVGLLLGLSALTRPTGLACLPALFWWVGFRTPDRPTVRLARMAALAACAALVLAPWVWRNYQVHNRFVLTRTGTAFVFWLGNNPYVFSGSALAPDGRAIIRVVPDRVRAHLFQLDELGQHDYFLAEATEFVRRHPGEFVRRWLLKFWYFWWETPQVGTFYPKSWIRLYRTVYAGIIGFAFVGLWGLWRDRSVTARQRQGALLILGFCVIIAVVQALYYVEGRHRLAIEPLLLIFTAAGISRLIDGRTGRE